jgi:hypothetical protein
MNLMLLRVDWLKNDYVPECVTISYLVYIRQMADLLQQRVERLEHRVKILEASNAAFRSDEEECDRIIQYLINDWNKRGMLDAARELKNALDPEGEIYEFHPKV